MAANWHYAKGGEKHGPVSASQLKELATNGKLSPDDLVWREDMTEWRKASTVKGLFPDQPTAAIEKPPQPKAISQCSAETSVSLWERPVILVLLVTCCFPVGLFLLWRSPRISQRQKMLWTGAFCGLAVMGFVISSVQRQATEKDLTRAQALWDEGKKTEAVALYQSVIKDRNSFISDDLKPIVYGRVIDHLAEQGSQSEVRGLMDRLDLRLSPVTPLVETESAKQLLAEIRRQKEAEKQEREAEEQRKKEQQALAAAARSPVTLDKSGRADFLDNTASYKGKAIRTECEWIGGGLRSRSTGRMTVLELDVWHTSGLFHVNVRVPEELDIPNIQSGDDLVVTFLCEQGLLNSGNTALKVERRE